MKNKNTARLMLAALVLSLGFASQAAAVTVTAENCRVTPKGVVICDRVVKK